MHHLVFLNPPYPLLWHALAGGGAANRAQNWQNRGGPKGGGPKGDGKGKKRRWEEAGAQPNKGVLLALVRFCGVACTCAQASALIMPLWLQRWPNSRMYLSSR